MDAIILMGSKSDFDFAKKIGETLGDFGIGFTYRIASAHKTPEKVLQILREYSDVVFITVAGRSNALSGFVDANTTSPVIACPPYSSKFSGMDILSSLRMPSGVSPMVVLEPENAALAAIKILSIKDSKLKEKLKNYQSKTKEILEKADSELSQQ
jgi:5-(carboxyamino)imidazole ribonucleotide mutase